jgi:hypothetical protein
LVVGSPHMLRMLIVCKDVLVWHNPWFGRQEFEQQLPCSTVRREGLADLWCELPGWRCRS